VRDASIREGHQIFTEELTRFADRTGESRIRPLIADVSAPVRVAVRGRDGVGRGTVAAALSDAGVSVCEGDTPADVDVVVVAEVLKPEDRAMLHAAAPAQKPVMVVLNKADLTGFGAGGPLVVADRRAAASESLTGVPTVAMVGLLAVAALDDELTGALRVLTAEAADLTSTDGFLAGEHTVRRDVRARLLDTLDLFGIAHGVLALRQGTGAAELPAVLRRLSRIDRVVARLAAVSAQVRYTRVRTALTRLRALAAHDAPAVADFLADDATVIAVMAAAVDVVEAAGVTVDTGDEPSAHLRRARYWNRYSRGPVNPIHRDCAADISRGSLRLMRRPEGR
jgi:hypothetical protein